MTDFSRLFQQLNNTGLQNKDNPLYQLLYNLIRLTLSLNSTVDANIISDGTSEATASPIVIHGIDGLDGMDGPIGPKGDTGLTGSSGQVGASGQDGLDGIDIIAPSGGRNFNFTKGSVIFSGPSGILAEDNANLFWDDVNDRLGINTAAPEAKLHVKSSDSSSYIVLENAAGSGRKWRVGESSGAGRFTIYDVTGTKEPLSINSTGEIGVGTPLAAGSTIQLGIEKGVNTNCVFQLYGSGIATLQFVADTALGATFKNVTNGAMYIGTNNTTRITISAAGDTYIQNILTYDKSAVFSWNAKSVDTVYQAASDGLVVFSVIASLAAAFYTGLTDSSNPPTTARCVAGSSLATATVDTSFTMPVKKGDYWRVITSSGSGTITLYWVPLGLAG